VDAEHIQPAQSLFHLRSNNNCQEERFDPSEHGRVAFSAFHPRPPRLKAKPMAGRWKGKNKKKSSKSGESCQQIVK